MTVIHSREETVSVSAIENYFLKGKNVQQNKKRRRKQKKDRRYGRVYRLLICNLPYSRGERGNDSQEEEEDDEEKEEEDEGDKRYEECDLNALRKFHEQVVYYYTIILFKVTHLIKIIQSHQLEAEVVEKLGKQHFDKWTLYLATGFNILVGVLLINSVRKRAEETPIRVKLVSFNRPNP